MGPESEEEWLQFDNGHAGQLEFPVSLSSSYRYSRPKTTPRLAGVILLIEDERWIRLRWSIRVLSVA